MGDGKLIIISIIVSSIGHVEDILPSQSFGLVLNKLAPANMSNLDDVKNSVDSIKKIY